MWGTENEYESKMHHNVGFERKKIIQICSCTLSVIVYWELTFLILPPIVRAKKH